MFFQERNKSVILHSRRLLQLIENFLKSTNFFVLFKVIRQLDVDLLVNVLIEKSDNDVYLLQISIIDDNEDKDNLVAYRLNNDCKDLCVV